MSTVSNPNPATPPPITFWSKVKAWFKKYFFWIVAIGSFIGGIIFVLFVKGKTNVVKPLIVTPTKDVEIIENNNKVIADVAKTEIDKQVADVKVAIDKESTENVIKDLTPETQAKINTIIDTTVKNTTTAIVDDIMTRVEKESK